MNAPIDALFVRSEGSQLISYAFENRNIRIQLFHQGLGALIWIEARTDTVYGRSIPASQNRSKCRLALGDLERVLAVHEGHYLPATDTCTALVQTRAHLNLAYGRRTADVRWIVTLHGEYNLLCFLLRDLADLQWSED